ncbi:MAG: hypothetical protein IT318_20325 [Anaerolineales bacterium]|nr:hypothetical protein [Anaerolineales bacterium]
MTTSSLADTLPKFIAEAALTLKQEGLMMGRVGKVRLAKGQGLTYHRPTWSAVSVLDLTEGVDLAQAQSVTDSDFTITVAEIGGQIFFSDLTEMALREDVMRYFGRALANAYKNAIDTDLTEDMDSATVSLGGAGTTTVIGHLQAAAVRLAAASRPVEGKLSCVIHPFQYHPIVQDLASLTSGQWSPSSGTPAIDRTMGSSVAGMSEQLIRNYWVGRLAGVDVFTDPNIAIDGSDDAKGGMFSNEAILSITYQEPSVRTQRDESLRGLELNYVGMHGSGMYDGAWAFEIYTDCSTPSS